MLLMNIDRIAKYYGTNPIFENLSWQLVEGARVGLIGPNGAGKSSLLKIIAGIERVEEGQATPRRGLKIAYLPQDVPAAPGDTPMSTALGARPDLIALAAQIDAVDAAFADPEVYSDMDRLAAVAERHTALLERYEEAGGPRLLNEATGLLKDLGFAPEEFEQELVTMSGGQRKLAYLARCLLARPDLLLLDEPDNHLDLEGKAYLEDAVADFDGAVVIISHDRYLLDDTVSQIAELADGRLTLYEGNYSSYALQREIALARQQQLWQSQQKEIKHLEEAIARFKLWASIVIDERHIKQARNKQRQLDSMDKVERPVLERRKMGLRLRATARGGQKVVELRGVSKRFPGEAADVLRNLNGLVTHGERVGIVGPNGAGKSVLFRLVLGQDEPTEGQVWVGPSIRLAYYAQEHQTLDLGKTPIELLREMKPMYEQEAIGFLGKFLFSYEMCRRPARTLSGGEKARLQLARLMLTGANCLLLDEPTNNLDIQSAEVLEAALEEFPGTVIVISHDRYFLDHVVDKIWEIDNARLSEYQGSWSDYNARRSTSGHMTAAIA